MQLRRQLLLVSLLSLSLPWVGCQYVKELDKSLQKGQSDTLEATAQAVAARLADDASARAQLAAGAEHGTKGSQLAIYLHPLPAVILDGYGDEWSAADLQFQSLLALAGDSDSPAKAIGAVSGQNAYLLLTVPDTNIHYYNPSESPLASDRLRLQCVDKSGTTRDFLVLASSPGQIETRDPKGQREHRLQGQWLESDTGYRVELGLPLAWIENGLQIDVFSGGDSQRRWSNSQMLADPPPILRRSQTLEHMLTIFKRPGVRLKIASPDAALLARVGDLQTAHTSSPWYFRWLYLLGSKRESLPNYRDENDSGFFSAEDVQSALQGNIAHASFALDEQRVSRSAVPIRASDNAQILGVIVAEQNATSLAAFTGAAMVKLLIYSFGLSVFTAVALVLYATWLSLRIRRLRNATNNAMSDSGSISDKFPVSSRRDEIGELSRSFAQLLWRLREYTQYLRTLSGKLSHELRTPLAIVSSSLDNLEHESLSANAKVFAERAKEGSARLTAILNAMSSATRVEQSIQSSELEVLQLDTLLAHIVDAYRSAYPHLQFKLHIVDNNGEYTALGSEELFVQMLDKLINNAADFCERDKPIELQLERVEKNIILAISNRGPLLPDHMRAQLFDSLVSVRDTRENGEHLGLGLYIVKLIAEFHRATVEANNLADASGVIITLRIPAHQSE